jgi:uncharacterized SAM-binding protein YcdF (DUF218 family)
MTINDFVQSLLPGSFPGLIFALVIGVALLYARDPIRRRARLWLTLVTVLYALLGTRVGVNAMMAMLNRHDQFITDPQAAQGATAVVLLTPSAGAYRARGGELSQVPELGALRILEAARVYRLLGSPWLILQGGFPELTDRPPLGVIAKDALVQLGIPPDRILIDPLSRNTSEHPGRLKPVLQAHGIRRFVLVTSPEHMWRASATFRKAGFDFVTSASAAKSELLEHDPALWPSRRHLDESAGAVHEYVGLLYYWLRGWI